MNASDFGYFTLGAGFVLLIKLIIAWAEATKHVNEVRERMDEYVPQQADFAHAYWEREARRVERPLEERSVAGVVYIEKQ